MKIHFLGTCSGTEPMPGMHQCSLVVEVNGTNYWFDAGECCGYTAHLMGLDVCKTRTLFISHPHLDHVAGLPHLLFVMWKFRRPLIHNNTLAVYTPDVDGLQAVLRLTQSAATLPFSVEGYRTHDGLLYEDENIRVTALHNTHLRDDGSNGWHSFSFLIEADGKRVVYSGDIGQLNEVDPLLEGGCDLLIMETGHHAVRDVCEHAIDKGVKRLRFNHHGREIINGREAAEALVAQYEAQYGVSIVLCHDGMTETVWYAQRIGNPDIILLDEATSALDTVSEKHIQQAIENLSRDKTTVIVAHRLSTIKNADKVAVIKDGQCVELGTFDELLAAKGEFYRFYQMQV